MGWFRIASYAALVFAVLFVAWFLFDMGGDATRNAIERQNNEAAREADDSRISYDRCRDAGRVWDFGTGECSRD